MESMVRDLQGEQGQEGMKEAARNHKALEGVIKTLRWTLGEVGVEVMD